MVTTPAARPAGCRAFLPAPAPSAPAGPSKISATRRSAARIAPRPARPSSSSPSISRARCCGVPADYRIGITPGSDTGAVEMALWSMLGARGVDVLAWESFGEGWVSDVVKELKLADARTLKAPYGELPDLAQGRFRQRRRLHLERHDLRRARRQRRLDRRRPQGPDDLRRDLGGVRASARLAKLDVVDLLLAEGARRRGGAWHDRAEPARGRAARNLQAGVAAAEAVPHDQGRQADRGHLRGRDDQHALDAVRRGLSRRAALGARSSAASRRCSRAPTPTPRRSPTGSQRPPWVDFLAQRAGDALQHQRLPEGRRSRGRRAVGRRAGRLRQGARRACSRRRRSPSTSAPIATRRRACASGAARRSKPPTSRR